MEYFGGKMDINPSFTYMNITDALLSSYVLLNQDVYPILVNDYVRYYIDIIYN